MITKNMKEILRTEKNVLVMALSAGIIKPEHNFSGEADRMALIQLTNGKFDIGKDEWKNQYYDIFLKEFGTDWPQMYIKIVKQITGEDISRGKAIATYIPIFSQVMKDIGNSIVPGVRESIRALSSEYGAGISILSGQETSIINGIYLRDGDDLGRFIDSAYVQGSILPSTPDNVRDRAYAIIQTLKIKKFPIRTLMLLDGNKERIANAGTKEWKEDLGIKNIIKIGIKDDWISKDLAEVTNFQYNNMTEFYKAIK